MSLLREIGRTPRKLRHGRASRPGRLSARGPGGGHLRRFWPAYAVLLVGLLLTVFAFYYVRQNVREHERARFEQDASSIRRTTSQRMDSYVNATLDARGLFAASKSVQRDEWHGYVTAADLQHRYPGIQALGFAERVPQNKERAYVEGVRKQGFRSFSLRPAGARFEYFPITYIDPSGGFNRRLFGYDPYSDPASRGTMEQARDTGLPQVSPRVDLPASAGPPGQIRFLVYTPVYRTKALPASVPERRDTLQGFIVGVFRADKLFKDIPGGREDSKIDFKVYDGAQLTPQHLLYDAAPYSRGLSRTALQKLAVLEVAGRWWSLSFSALPGYESRWQHNLPLLVLAGGSLISLSLFGVAWTLILGRLQAERAGAALETANRKLAAANDELEAFSYSVSHDLRAPLRSINGFSQILLEDYTDSLDEEGRGYLNRVQVASRHMGRLIDDLLELSRVTRSDLRRQSVDLSALAREVASELQRSDPGRRVRFVISDGLTATGDAGLLRVLLENLLGNAWKFTSREPEARIEFGADPTGGEPVYFVRDNGAGFDMAYADKLFGAFQRLHGPEEFEGTGVGLATVQRVVRRHGGSVWAEGEVGRGATFYFTLTG